jgi:EmrB/QacA subfamily drug resistance transporter
MRTSRLSSAIPFVVACAFFMENFDATVITTALPAMARSLRADPVTLSVAVTAYLVSLAVFIPVSGWLSDRYGTSRTFRAAIVVFTGASVCCGLATSLPALVAARALQGMGGAMMVPVGRLIILRSFSRAEFVRAMAAVTTPALIGPALGPPVGGFITTYLSWRWIFFLNVPIGVLGIVLASLWIENIREEEVPPFDWRGFVLTGVAVGLLMTALDVVVRGGANAGTIALFGAAAGFAVAAVAHARRVASPLVDVSLMRLRTFAASMGPGLLFRAAAFATPFLLPLLFQVGFGLTAFVSGLLTFSAAAGALVMKAWVPRILRRYGFRTALTATGVVTGLMTLALAAFDRSTAVAWIVAAVTAYGFGRSLELSALNAFTFADVPPEKMSAATSFSGMLQQLSAGIGIAASALLLRLVVTLRGASLASLDARDIRHAIVVVALVSLTAGFCFLRLDRTAGLELSGHRRIPASEGSS